MNTTHEEKTLTTADFAEAVAPIADGQQLKRIRRSRLAPASGNGLGGLAGGQRAFELVRSDENAHGQSLGLQVESQKSGVCENPPKRD